MAIAKSGIVDSLLKEGFPLKKALEMALNGSIELSYQKEPGLFDLQISIYKNKLMILVEDYLLNNSENIESNKEEVKNMLSSVKDLTDGLSFSGKTGRIGCYSMYFDVSYMEENNVSVPS